MKTLLGMITNFGKCLIPIYSIIFMVLYFLGSYFLFNWICDFHPGYLVDEIFHIEMGVKYCRGNYSEWNDKITTLPGLYILSVPVLKVFSLIFQTDVCNVYYLRMVNYMLGIFNYPLFGTIILHISDLKTFSSLETKSKCLIYIINQGLFPVLYFFTFFYYTEPMSVCWVFGMYYLYLKGCHKSAACAGVIAILIRQTNVVWVGFILILQFMTELMNDMRKLPNCKRIIDDGEPVGIVKILVKHAVQKLLTWDVLITRYLINSAYFYVCVLFVSFVVTNKGIVVGDKEAHSLVIHVPQLLYFCLFYLFFSPTSIIVFLPKFLRAIIFAKKKAALIAFLMAVIIYSNTLVHPYLLADNRHYAFYVWKRLYESNFTFRYLLIPVYMLGGYCIIERLKEAKIPFMVAYIIATVIILVPQKLFEFRYFVQPFLFISLNSRNRHIWEVLLESVYYVLINAATFYIFFSREIVWSDDQTIHRFLW